METNISNKCKAYTSVKQSKRLAEILPIESADMYYLIVAEDEYSKYPGVGDKEDILNELPCWSIASLLDYLSANSHVDIKYLDNYWELDCRVQVTYGKELVDACVDMIIKLHEQNLL